MTSTVRQPAIFLSHGGGPCFWMDWPAPFGPGAWDGLGAYLESIAPRLPERPKAILVISAHWETERPTVGSAAQPVMIYDYYGFPEHTYQLQYPAAGSPELAGLVRALLSQAGIAADEDPDRGFDHGVFVPLLKAFPGADIPVVTLSLRHDLDPAAHLAIGRALEPLRDEGVLILGSGMSFHDLRHFRDGEGAISEGFDAWLQDAVTHETAQTRVERLTDWALAPFARSAHPREEHLLPLMVVAGAAGHDLGRADYSEVIGGKRISGFAFG
ncbi:class III extradiol ring-cleavage dioxygenase [soil metagenome]